MKTDEEKQENYIKGEGCFCPHCGSDQIEGGSFNGEGNLVFQKINCMDCEESWDDVYTLTKFVER